MTAAANSFYFEWEQALILWIQRRFGAFGTAAASLFSVFGESVVMFLVMGFLYWCWDKETGKKVALIIIFSNVFSFVLKNIFKRSRPYMDNSAIACLKPVEKSADIYDIAAQGYAFPSGHSTNSTAIYVSGAVCFKKQKWLRPAAVILPLLCGISRFCLGVHYPTDVLAGWLIGLIAVFLISFLNKIIKKEWVLHVGVLVVSCLGIFFCRSNDYYSSLGLMIGFTAACPFEKKYIHFKNTRNVLQIILRLLIGGGVFFGLNTLLKLPFTTEFLENGTLLSFMVRAFRYGVVMFVVMAVYPLLFPYLERLFPQKKKPKTIS